MHRIVKLVFTAVFEYTPKALNHLGAAVRWTYLRNENSFAEIKQMDGNIGIGLLIATPIAAVCYITLSR